MPFLTVTLPLEFTVILLLPETFLNLIFPLLFTVALKDTVFAFFFSADAFTVADVFLTLMVGAGFVTLIVTTLLPALYVEVAAALIVIFAVPRPFTVILPFLSTVATFLLLDL